MNSEIKPTGAALSIRKIDAFFNPRNIVVVGASDRPANWAMKIYKNLTRYGFPGPIYPINPGRQTVWDKPCHASFTDLPEAPDHVLVLVTAEQVAETIANAAAAGARSATIYTSGFEELGTQAREDLAQTLRDVIARTGMAVSGPNCLGNISAAAKLMTLPDERHYAIAPGPAAVIGQSGSIVIGIHRALAERGIDAGYVATLGNQAGLTTADYIHYFAASPDVRVVVCYLESIKDAPAFLDACRAAQKAGKPIIVVKLGGSEEGQAAAQAHTGAIAGSAAAFDAVAEAAGALRVATVDDAVECAEFFLHAPLPQGDGLGVIAISGGVRGLMLDSALEKGIELAKLSDKTLERLDSDLGVGTIIGNPLDMGFAALSSHDVYVRTVQTILDDPAVAMALVQEELPRTPGANFKETAMRLVGERIARTSSKPVGFFSMVSYGLNDYARQFRNTVPELPFVQEVDKSLRMVANVMRYARNKRMSERAVAALPKLPVTPAIEALAAAAHGDGTPLDEIASKAILKACGLRVPEEAIATSAAAACVAATRIGLPVVIKIVSPSIAHKSDAGCVLLDIRTLEAVAEGYEKILNNARAYDPAADIRGVLVAPYIAGGLELVLGIKNDSDMGPIVMVGTGGIWLELFKDVAFGPPGLDAERVEEMISRTKMTKLLDGYRGAPPRDRTALVDAVIALGRFARDHGHLIEAVDVNPFVVLEQGRGAWALDALVIPRRGAR
jgi:acyl-CoA synthetase (NDP forming)